MHESAFSHGPEVAAGWTRQAISSSRICVHTWIHSRKNVDSPGLEANPGIRATPEAVVGRMHRLALWFAKNVATLVSRNELFEKDGDRPTEPPLDKKAWTGGSDVGTATGEEGGA